MKLEDLYDPEWPDDRRPWVDQSDTDPGHLSTWAAHWRERGWVTFPDLIDEATLGDYEDAWLAANGPPTYDAAYRSPGGWDYVTPHRDVPALTRLVSHPEIHERIEALLGEPAAVHLSLTPWITTGRDWHCDNYLLPPGSDPGGFYVGVWVALDTIHPDSGPFQLVDGSHRWPPLSHDKVRAALGADGEGPDWPTKSEGILTPLFENKIRTDGLAPTSYLPSRGDVLFWSSRLLHRGSRARVTGMERRGVIFHASGVNHRRDLPAPVGRIFPIDDRGRLPATQLTGGA